MVRLCPKIVSEANEDSIQEAMSDIVRGTGGDPMRPGETFLQYFQRTLYIPALAHETEFMKFTPRTLSEFLQANSDKPGEVDKVQKKVCLFSKQLEEISNDRMLVEPPRWNDDKKLFQVVKDREFNWLVKFTYGRALYYVPLDFFP
jgi:hypothetical protein